MTAPIGKFDIKPAVRFVSRWDVDVLDSFGFNDPEHGLLIVPEDSVVTRPRSAFSGRFAGGRPSVR